MKFFSPPWNVDPSTILGSWAALDGLFQRDITTYSTSDTGTTLTGAQFVGGIFIRTAASGEVTDNLPSAGNIISACPGTYPGGALGRGGNILIGWSGVFRYCNSSTQPVNLVAGTGVTISSNSVLNINAMAWVDYQFQITGIGANAAVTMQMIGSGTVAPFGSVLFRANATAPAANNTNLTANDVYGAADMTVSMTAALAAGATLTLPTVAALAADLAGVMPGMGWRWRVFNNSSGNFAYTLTTNTGWTFNVTTATIAQFAWRDFYITVQSATAATIQSIGLGATAGGAL